MRHTALADVIGRSKPKETRLRQKPPLRHINGCRKSSYTKLLHSQSCFGACSYREFRHACNTSPFAFQAYKAVRPNVSRFWQRPLRLHTPSRSIVGAVLQGNQGG